MSSEAFKLIVSGLVALVSAVAAPFAVEWIKRLREKPKEESNEKPSPRRPWFLLILVGAIAGVVGFIVTNAAWDVRPRVAITSPSDSLEVTVEGESVWFPVSGTSTRVFSDNSLRVYVVVHSGTEWHIQRPASVEPNGNWALDRAWIGDSTLPVRVGSALRITAVVSRQNRPQNEKVQETRQLEPEAQSSTVIATVRKVRVVTKP